MAAAQAHTAAVQPQLQETAIGATQAVAESLQVVLQAATLIHLALQVVQAEATQLQVQAIQVDSLVSVAAAAVAVDSLAAAVAVVAVHAVQEDDTNPHRSTI